MANEELVQRNYLATGRLAGDPFGHFEEFNLGSTTLKELVAAGISAVLPTDVNYPFNLFSAHLAGIISEFPLS